MVNRGNYALVKEFLRSLEDENLDSSSLSRYWFYQRHMLLWADNTPLAKANQLRPSLVTYVAKLPGRRGEDNLVTISQKKIIDTAKRFFIWAKMTHPTEFKSLPPWWIEKLKLGHTTDMSETIDFVSFDEINRLVYSPLEKSNLDLLRSRAAVAFLYLTGMRAKAFTTLPIKAVNLAEYEIYQWPALGVKTKNGKKATTTLLPIPELMEVVYEWDAFVRQNYPDYFPWFAPIKADWGKYEIDLDKNVDGKAELGKNRSINLNKRLRVFYKTLGMPFHSAHKFRHGHAVWGLMHARNMADYKAVSINMMHEDVETTDRIYVDLLPSDTKQRILDLAHRPLLQPDTDLVAYVNGLAKNQLPQALASLSDAIALAAKRLADER